LTSARRRTSSTLTGPPGDRVIVTDLPALAGHDRVALK
jgi:hypothetical protein